MLEGPAQDPQVINERAEAGIALHPLKRWQRNGGDDAQDRQDDSYFQNREPAAAIPMTPQPVRFMG
jgi:hypothetical protein